MKRQFQRQTGEKEENARCEEGRHRLSFVN